MYNVVIGDRVDDQVALMDVDPHGWLELAALRSECQHTGDRFERLREIVDIPIRLLDRPGFSRKPLDVVKVG